MAGSIIRESGKRYQGRTEVEHEEHGSVGDRSDGRKFKKVQSVPQKQIIDESTPGVIYLGETKAGTATSEALWRIRRITESGGITTLEFADGDDKFDNVFDNRASLSYS